MAPPRKSTGLVRGKANRPEESDNDNSSQDEEQVHKLPKGVKAEILAEYRYKPIDFRTGETKLKQLLAELKITTTGLDECLDSLTDAATDVAEVLPAFRDEFDENDMPKDHDDIAALDTLFRKILDASREVTLRQAVLHDLRQKFAQGHQITDVSAVYESKAANEIEAYRTQTSRQKYGQVDSYVNFRTVIFEAMYYNEGIPGINKFIPAEEGDDEEDSDDEIQVKNQQFDYKCPLTLGILVIPVTSTKCRHIFSRDAILGMLRCYEHLMESPAPPKGHAPCPQPGCSAILGPEDLKESADLAKRVEQYVKRLKEEQMVGTQKGGTEYQEISDDDSD